MRVVYIYIWRWRRTREDMEEGHRSVACLVYYGCQQKHQIYCIAVASNMRMRMLKTRCARGNKTKGKKNMHTASERIWHAMLVMVVGWCCCAPDGRIKFMGAACERAGAALVGRICK